ncbi:MAG: ABC transporter permease [Verrucomicrobiota bacterium]
MVSESLRLAWQVVVRNWTVYRKDFLANISPSIADPALILLALGFGLSPFIGEIDGLSYAGYLAPGMIATIALFTAFFECSYGFYVTLTFESVFKAMLTTPIGVNEVILGEFIWVFIRAALMALGVSIVLLAFGLLPNPAALVWCPLLAGLVSLSCGGIGLIASSFVRNINQFQTIYSFLISPIFYLSGIFFPVSGIPVLEYVVQFSPFYHGVRLIQMTVWGNGVFVTYLWHGTILLAFTLVLGAVAFHRIRKRLVQ